MYATRGRHAPVERWVPEIGSGYRGATIQHVLDMDVANDYTEDFSQYQPRSYYEGNPLLEAYFRAVMWLGRITFTARSIAARLSSCDELSEYSGGEAHACAD